jgi:sugar O-acyltransferase (sialic acid O-acetyltransferase NeuD family)
MRNLVIIGAGGFAREMFDLANTCYGNENDFSIKGFLSDGPSKIESMGYPAVISKVDEYQVQEDDVFFCAIGNLKDRKKTIEIILSKGGTFINLIHPTAILSPSVKLGIGVGIKSFCVLASDVIVEDFTFLQSSVIMGHDVHIGKYCQVNSFSFFAGYVRVHDLVSVNAGVRIIQNMIIEEESVVGIGSVVLRRVKKGTTVFGNPAKKIEF